MKFFTSIQGKCHSNSFFHSIQIQTPYSTIFFFIFFTQAQQKEGFQHNNYAESPLSPIRKKKMYLFTSRSTP